MLGSSLSKEELDLVHVASLQVLEEVGVRIYNRNALELLAEGGAAVDFRTKTAYIPPYLVEKSLAEAPSLVKMYSYDGNNDVVLGGKYANFTPGGGHPYVLDHRTGERRLFTSQDFADFTQLTDSLENINIQGAPLISDAPEVIRDRYALYLQLKSSPKVILTDAYTVDGVVEMKQMLEAVSGGEKELMRKPRALFAGCPSPPLKWSENVAQNLLDCARFRIPFVIGAMEQLGGSGPATMAGCLAQANAEILSGVVLSQLVNPGAPIIYGGIPGLFDMRYGTGRYGGPEALMLGLGFDALGKYYRLPTYLFAGSDAKVIDSQSGFETGIPLVLEAFAGVNLVEGMGMLDSFMCLSFEKLVIDNEICGMALRFKKGINISDETLALEEIRQRAKDGNYLGSEYTYKWFKKERYIPSDIITREMFEEWKRQGSKDIATKAKEVVDKSLKQHKPQALSQKDATDLDKVLTGIMKRLDIASLPLGP